MFLRRPLNWLVSFIVPGTVSMDIRDRLFLSGKFIFKSIFTILPCKKLQECGGGGKSNGVESQRALIM